MSTVPENRTIAGLQARHSLLEVEAFVLQERLAQMEAEASLYQNAVRCRTCAQYLDEAAALLEELRKVRREEASLGREFDVDGAAKADAFASSVGKPDMRSEEVHLQNCVSSTDAPMVDKRNGFTKMSVDRTQRAAEFSITPDRERYNISSDTFERLLRGDVVTAEEFAKSNAAATVALNTFFSEIHDPATSRRCGLTGTATHSSVDTPKNIAGGGASCVLDAMAAEKVGDAFFLKAGSAAADGDLTASFLQVENGNRCQVLSAPSEPREFITCSVNRDGTRHACSAKLPPLLCY